MKTPSIPLTEAAGRSVNGVPSNRLPLWLKLAYTAFMAVLVPVYWTLYGPSNFLYFCDVALFLTLAGLWLESRLLLSLPAVGILLPQAFWCADFVLQVAGYRLTGMTAYMFDPNRPIFLRGLSLFHGWLPFLLLFAVRRVGYDRRAWLGWSGLAWGLCLVCFAFLPPAGRAYAGQLAPNNINYVWGFDDAQPQSWLPAELYLLVWMTGLFLLIYTPTHLFLGWWGSRSSAKVHA
jgi:hypothetical protein